MKRIAIISILALAILGAGFVGCLYYLGGQPPVVNSASELAFLPEEEVVQLADGGALVSCHGSEFVYMSEKQRREVKAKLASDAIIQHDTRILDEMPDVAPGTHIQVLISGDRVLAVHLPPH